ncbi:MAG: GNAT family N-acetyltransferase [Chloroflexota bacterium]
MPKFSFRPYQGPTDLDIIVKIVSQRPKDRIVDYPNQVNLQAMLGVPQPKEAVAIWFDESGQSVGFTLLDNFTLQLEILPPESDYDLGQAMIDWAVPHLRDRKEANQSALNIRTNCRSTQTERLTFLKRLGFIQETGFTWHYARSLAEPIAQPQVPPDFTIRALAGEAEVAEYVAVHRAAFDTQLMTVEDRVSRMATPNYISELDLVAIAPNREIAAYVFGQIHQQDNALTGRKEGYTDPVGTHPDYRRRGLARSLLLTGLTLLKKHGMDTAKLGTWFNNTPMQRTAEVVGFRRVDRTLFFRKGIEK